MPQSFNTACEIVLRGHGSPHIRYGLNSNLTEITVTGLYTINFDLLLDCGVHKFTLDFFNKTNDTPNMAVEIVSVSFEGIQLDRAKWAGVYTPQYPEPWASEQTEPLPATRTDCTYLGWNGTWELEFSVPVFTWIHKLENLGWIYS